MSKYNYGKKITSPAWRMRWRHKKHFLPSPSDAFYSYFNGNEEYFSYFHKFLDSYPGSGYWQQFEEVASARQSSLIASGKSNNANASLADKICRTSRVVVERTPWVKLSHEISFLDLGRIF